MLEKILISLATSLFEKLGKYLFNWIEQKKAEGKEHERIRHTMDRLIDAESKEDIATAFDSVP